METSFGRPLWNIDQRYLFIASIFMSTCLYINNLYLYDSDLVSPYGSKNTQSKGTKGGIGSLLRDTETRSLFEDALISDENNKCY